MGLERTTRGRVVRLAAVLAWLGCLAALPAAGDELDDARKALADARPSFDAFSPGSIALPAHRPSSETAAPLRRSIGHHGFLKRHLVPRVSHQLGRVTPIHSLEVDRSDWERSGLHGWFSGTTGHYANRGLRRAARAYFVEDTAVGTFLDSLRLETHRGDAPQSGRTVNYRLGVSHGKPRLEMRHRSPAGTTRFGVGVNGSLRLEFHPAHSGGGRVSAGYDPGDSSYSLSFRHSY